MSNTKLVAILDQIAILQQNQRVNMSTQWRRID